MNLQHIARYFKQQDFSDVDLKNSLCKAVKAPNNAAERCQGSPTKRAKSAAADDQLLSQFPAHRLVLAGTDYFKAQVHAWAEGDASCSDAPSSSAVGSRPQLRLTLDSEEQLAAAEAVIEALYGVPDALKGLQQHQLVDAVMLADKLGAAAVAEQAVHLLAAAAAAADSGLTEATMEALASLLAWPACLLPLLLPAVQSVSCCRNSSATNGAAVAAADTGSRLQRILLAVLGDLEAVWRDTQLQQLLMALPLTAMQLLLSSDQLRVASEDTVLYTASKLVAASPYAVAPTIRAALAPLVRAPHLSGTLLSGQALSSSSHDMLLASYSTPLKQLISIKLATNGAAVPAVALDQILGAPAAWKLGKRQITLLTASRAVQLVWRLPVDSIAKACRDSFAGGSFVLIDCDGSSPPLGGVTWSLRLQCQQAVTNNALGTIVGLYAVPHEPQLVLGGDVLLVFACTLSCNGISEKLSCSGCFSGFGVYDFFKLGPMSAGGGWDEAAWAAKGLPTSGELELSLHMHSVGF